MKVLSTEGLTKLIDLIKSSFISNEDTQATVAVDAVETTAVDAVETNVATLATVATTGSYNDLSDKPTVDQTYDGTSANAQSGVAVASAISTMLSTLYPVGSIYIGTQSTCPLASLISGSTWELVSEGRVLQGSDSNHSAGSTIAAGLPDITGGFESATWTGSSSGMFNRTERNTHPRGTGNTFAFDTYDVKASYSNSVYGNSTTVQPPAFVVNIWKRTA